MPQIAPTPWSSRAGSDSSCPSWTRLVSNKSDFELRVDADFASCAVNAGDKLLVTSASVGPLVAIDSRIGFSLATLCEPIGSSLAMQSNRESIRSLILLLQCNRFDPLRCFGWSFGQSFGWSFDRFVGGFRGQFDSQSIRIANRSASLAMQSIHESVFRLVLRSVLRWVLRLVLRLVLRSVLWWVRKRFANRSVLLSCNAIDSPLFYLGMTSKPYP